MQGNLQLEFEDDAAYYSYIRAPLDVSKFWSRSFVDIIEIRDGRSRYMPNLNDASVLDHLAKRSKQILSRSENQPEIRIFIIPLDFYPHDPPQQARLRATADVLDRIVEAFQIPRYWIAAYLERHQELFTNVINSCFVERDDTGPAYLRCFYRYHSGWGHIRAKQACTYLGFDFETSTSTYVLINPPVQAVQRLRTAHGLGRLSELSGRPQFVNALVLSESLVQWTDVTRNLRKDLLKFERKGAEAFAPRQLGRTTEELHALTKRWNMLEEDLNDFEDRMKFILAVEERLFGLRKEKCKASDRKFKQPAVDTMDSFNCIVGRLQHLRRWTIAYRRRTDIRINLVFNKSAQTDSSTNLTIAARTGEIAREASKDSASMITIAAVTLFFLPGTFVSALFSMAFFSFEPSNNGSEEFRVSKLYWVYIAITIPLTLVVIAVWAAWQKWRVNRRDKPFTSDHSDEETAAEEKNDKQSRKRRHLPWARFLG